LGFPFWAVASAAVVRHYYGIFVHLNKPWTLGILGRVFVSPAMHRWHHVREGKGMNSNFAGVFSIFDQLFGTYYCPGPCRERLGVAGVRDLAFFQQMIDPFFIMFLRPFGRIFIRVKETKRQAR